MSTRQLNNRLQTLALGFQLRLPAPESHGNLAKAAETFMHSPHAGAVLRSGFCILHAPVNTRENGTKQIFFLNTNLEQQHFPTWKMGQLSQNKIHNRQPSVANRQCGEMHQSAPKCGF